MDFSEEVRWHNPLSWMRSLPDRESFNRASRQQRKTFPEIHLMKIVAVLGKGRFDLEAPWGAVVKRVKCVDFNLTDLLAVDTWVYVRYDMANNEDVYIRSIAPAKGGVPSES